MPRRGRMSNGPSRGGGSGRGGRGGGRLGSRTFQPRDGGPNRNNYGPRPVVDMWNANTVSNDTGTVENWDNDFPSPIDDWYNEEYTGSLADTKVFTPSSVLEQKEKERGTSGPGMGGDTDGGGLMNQPPTELSALTATQQLTQAIELRAQQQASPSPNSVPQPTGAVAGAQLGVGTLTASQSQFLSSLAAQNEDAKTNNAFATSATTNQYGASAVSNTYGAPVNTSSYGNTQSYGIQDQMNAQTQQAMQPTRTKTQRARVPPPSKVSTIT